MHLGHTYTDSVCVCVCLCITAYELSVYVCESNCKHVSREYLRLSIAYYMYMYMYISILYMDNVRVHNM